MQIIHVLIANSILFAAHIYEKFIKNDADLSRYSIKSVFIVSIYVTKAPLLEELLFRAAFYKIGKQLIPNYVIALFFSISTIVNS